jgi:hypothetical protein
MRHIPQADLLQALKQSLHDLDNVKLLSPDDLDILDLRRNLREQIAAIERQASEIHVNQNCNVSEMAAD